MIGNATFQIERDFLTGRILIIAWNDHGCFVAGPDGEVTLKRLEPGEMAVPFMVFRHRDTASLQSLADALAKFGVMPTAGDNAKELTATKAHLADMQSMANRAFAHLLEKAK